MLPRQPCLRSGAWYAVEPAGHADAVCLSRSWSRSVECHILIDTGCCAVSEAAMLLAVGQASSLRW